MPTLENVTIVYSIFAYMRFVQQTFRNIFANKVSFGIEIKYPLG